MVSGFLFPRLIQCKNNIQEMHDLSSWLPFVFHWVLFFSSFLAALYPVPPYMRTCTMNLFRLSLFATCYTFTVAKMILSLSVMSEL